MTCGAEKRCWKDVHHPNPYPGEFRDAVVNVARGREPGQTIKQIASDLGIPASCLRNLMRQSAAEDGSRPGITAVGERRAR